MTKQEYKACEKLMYEAIGTAKLAQAEFQSLYTITDEVRKSVTELQAQNHLGYAHGVNQVLAVLRFKHDNMKELSELI